MRNKILAIVVLMLFVQQAKAQWTKGEGKGYYKLSFWSLVADQHYTSSGEIDPNATRGNFTTSLYAEYGVTNKIDIITYVPFVRVYQNKRVSGVTGNTLQEGEAVNALGDVDVALRYALHKSSKLALSGSLKLGLPTGKSTGGSDGSFQTGDGEFNQQLQFDLGVPFKVNKVGGYGKITTAFNNRTQGFSDEFHYGLELGIKPIQKFWAIARLYSVNSFNNGSLSAQTAQGSIFANNVEYTSVGVELAYYLTKKLGVSLNYTSAVSGKIIYAAPSYSGGLFLEL